MREVGNRAGRHGYAHDELTAAETSETVCGSDRIARMAAGMGR